MLCSFMDSLYFYGLLALGGLCAHLYEYPPTNSTLCPIWAPTVRRAPPLTLTTSQSPPRLPAPLHPHSDSPLYLTHSTTNQSGGCSRRQCPRTPHSWRTRSNDLVLTTILAGACSISVNMLCIFMDCWLCGVSVHISTSTPPRIPHSPPSGLRL